MKIQIFILFCLWAVCLGGQPAVEFSGLSSRTFYSGSFSSLTLPDGYLYLGAPPDGPRYIYKINLDGLIIDSLSLFIDGYYYSGSLTRHENRNFLIGRANPPFAGNYAELFAARRTAYIEFDDQLNILKIQHYAGIIPPLTAVSTSIQFGSPVYSVPVGAQFIVDDTLFSLAQYARFDTLNGQFTGTDFQFEKLGLDGAVYAVKSMNANLVYHILNAVPTATGVAVYGTATGNNSPFGESLAEYDLDGNFRRLLSFDLPGEDYFSGSSASITGERYGDYIFSAYNSSGFALPGICEQEIEEGLVIDKRDMNFNLVKRQTIPGCGYPGGRNCFAFTPAGEFFYLTQTEQGSLFLYKYDLDLQLVWARELGLPGYHSAIGIREAENGGCIIESFVAANEPGFWVWKLYKVDNKGDIVSATSSLPTTREQPLFYPNPFTGILTLGAEPGHTSGPLQVSVYDVQGKFWGNFHLHHNQLEAGALPAGSYIFHLKNTLTGRIYGTQKMTRF